MSQCTRLSEHDPHGDCPGIAGFSPSQREGSMFVQLDDGRAAEIITTWEEPKIFDGHNHVGRFTRNAFRSVDLGRTRTGLWVMLPKSSHQGERPQPHTVTAAAAAGWFAACEMTIPQELQDAII